MRSRQLDTFVKTLVTEPTTLMGIRLLPYSLGHLFHMQRFECGFVNEDPDFMGSPLDLYLGVSICGRTYEDFLEFINATDDYIKFHKHWGEEVEKYIRSMSGDLKENIFMYFITKTEEFKKYIQNGISVPEYWESDKNNNNTDYSGAHWSQNVYSSLLAETQFSESQILNMPLAKALSIVFKLAENKGSLTLKADWELDELDRQKESNAQ